MEEGGGEEASQVRRVSGSSGKESETSINSDFGGMDLGPWCPPVRTPAPLLWEGEGEGGGGRGGRRISSN